MIIGQKVSDRYRIEKLIGGGGMSNVYLAHDLILDRQVAIKILRYDFTNEEELHKRFQREAMSATSLTHPNIVPIYDVGEDGDMHYIVMEYIEGKTLKKYIQEHSPLSPARTVHIMKQLTSALAHAHDNGIIHRDIKPQNLLVNQDGNVKITDFGIATTLSATSYTQTNSVIGTVHYLSPEQARGGIATNQSDIYALGIVMYELLTGELPFSGESAVAIALKHLQAETPSVRSFDATIPQSVENIVLKATDKNILHRYATAQQMEADLETALSPSRIHEPKYEPPIDNDATRVIPIIKNNETIAPLDLKQPPVVEEVKLAKDPAPIPVKNTEAASPGVTKEAMQPEKLEKKKRKKWPIVVGSLLLAAAVVIFLWLMLSPNKVAIPDVTALSVEEARKQLQEAGFNVTETIERNSDEVEEGKVIVTTPSQGTLRTKGSDVQLIVSIGKTKAVMQNYVNRSYEQVASLLEQYEFKAIEQPEERYDSAPEGTIIDQSPAAGEEIVIDQTTVRFVVSKGPKPETVANLAGYNESALNQYAQSSGFKIVTKESVYSDSVPAGSVVSQSPQAGAEVEAGSTIEVTLSKGPEEKQIKYYFYDVEIPYTAEQPQPAPVEEPAQEGEVEDEENTPPVTPEVMEPVEQTVRVYIQDKDHTMAEPADTFTIREAKKYRIQLTIEEGSDAAYRITVDNNVVFDEKVPYDY